MTHMDNQAPDDDAITNARYLAIAKELGTEARAAAEYQEDVVIAIARAVAADAIAQERLREPDRQPVIADRGVAINDPRTKAALEGLLSLCEAAVGAGIDPFMAEPYLIAAKAEIARLKAAEKARNWSMERIVCTNLEESLLLTNLKSGVGQYIYRSDGGVLFRFLDGLCNKFPVRS